MVEGWEVGWRWSDLLRKDCSCQSSGYLGLAEGFVTGFEIDKRKREMDKQNRRKDRISNRTANAKAMVFETADARKFMIMNASTLEKID